MTIPAAQEDVREKLSRGLSIGDHIGKSAGLTAKGRKILSGP
jgi:hypothetical protein